MKIPSPTFTAKLFAAFAFCASTSVASIYVTDFTGYTAGNEFVKDFNIHFGGQNPGVNFKAVSSGQWGITGNSNDFADDNLRPQNNPATNLKMAGVFLDPSLFAGVGTYTVNFDLTGDTGGNAAYRAYVFAGSGYDLSGTEDKRLNLSLSAGGFGGYSGLTATGTGVTASQLTMVDISTEATTAGTSPISFTFEYDGSSAIAIAVGGFNNAATIDNFSVVPEPATIAFWAGLGVLGLIAYRRRK